MSRIPDSGGVILAMMSEGWIGPGVILVVERIAWAGTVPFRTRMN